MSPSSSENASPAGFYLTYVPAGDELVLNFGRNPVQTTSESPRILVLGGGVSGLTSAWALLDAGYQVIVVSERWASPKDRITSQVAGALWEWPPVICGEHISNRTLDNSKKWCMTSYRALEKLMDGVPVEVHGVRMRMTNFFFEKKIEEMEDQIKRMLEIEAQSEIRGFLRDPTLVSKHCVNQKAGVEDSFRLLSPVIDTDHYLGFLHNLITSRGGKFETGKVAGDLLSQQEDLLAKYDARAIVNATGLSSYDLAGDRTVMPLRGALIRVVNDGSKFPQVTEALCVSHDDEHGEPEDAEDIVFIVPRNDKVLILGGLVQANVHTLDLTLESPEIVRMRERCNNFVPGLENAEYDAVPFVQGLRPFRDKDVCVERDRRSKADGSASRVVHSYGHGGSGFTLSYGCAGTVVGLVNGLVARNS